MFEYTIHEHNPLDLCVTLMYIISKIMYKYYIVKPGSQTTEAGNVLWLL